MHYSSLTMNSRNVLGDRQARDMFGQAGRKGAFALLASLFIFIITAAGYAGLYYLNTSQEETQQRLAQQIQQKEDDLRPKVLDTIFALQKKLQTASVVLSSHVFVTNTLALMERDTHPRVSFDSYSFSPKDHMITLKGDAEDYAVIAKQIAFLEGDQLIDSVEFGGLTLRENRHVSFNLTIHVMPALTMTSKSK